MNLLQKLFGKKSNHVELKGTEQDAIDAVKVETVHIKPEEQDKPVVKVETVHIEPEEQVKPIVKEETATQTKQPQVGGFNQETWDKVEKLITISEHYAAYNLESINRDVFKDYNGQNSYEIYKRGIKLLNKEIDILEHQCNIYCVCSKGCSYCCEQAIYLSCAEMEIVSKKLVSMSDEEKRQIKDKNNKLLEIMKLNNLPLSMSATDEQLAEKTNNDFLRLQLRCPLIDDNGNCSIYEVRPSSCWPYRNYGHKIDCKGKIAEHSYPHHEMGSILTGRLNMEKLSGGKNIFIFESLPKVIKDVLG